MNMPGSPYRVAPLTRNVIANSVLPHPAAPHTSDGRPAGKPPSVISSKPAMPVGAFGSAVRVAASGDIGPLSLSGDEAAPRAK